ncbi:MAG: hypothetical protein IIX02_05870, partial [Clostridia bacterium]|nr:hypothetical protein [Clostridia bacterium]
TATRSNNVMARIMYVIEIKLCRKSFIRRTCKEIQATIKRQNTISKLHNGRINEDVLTPPIY